MAPLSLTLSDLERSIQVTQVFNDLYPNQDNHRVTKLMISSSSFNRLDMTLAVAEALNPNKPNPTIDVG